MKTHRIWRVECIDVFRSQIVVRLPVQPAIIVFSDPAVVLQNVQQPVGKWLGGVVVRRSGSGGGGSGGSGGSSDNSGNSGNSGGTWSFD